MYWTLRITYIICEVMFTVHGYFGKFWICVILGTKSLHNFDRTTTPDWKEIPNTIEGAKDGKNIDSLIAKWLFPFP